MQYVGWRDARTDKVITGEQVYTRWFILDCLQ